jgi:hypothetical protein
MATLDVIIKLIPVVSIRFCHFRSLGIRIDTISVDESSDRKIGYAV